MINRDELLKRLHAVWSTGGGRIMSYLEQAARYHSVPLEQLTDEQIDAWLVREIDRIYSACWGSALNG